MAADHRTIKMVSLISRVVLPVPKWFGALPLWLQLAAALDLLVFAVALLIVLLRIAIQDERFDDSEPWR